MTKYIDMEKLNQEKLKPIEIILMSIIYTPIFYVPILIAHLIWWMADKIRGGFLCVLTMDYYPGKRKYKKKGS